MGSLILISGFPIVRRIVTLVQILSAVAVPSYALAQFYIRRKQRLHQVRKLYFTLASVIWRLESILVFSHNLKPLNYLSPINYFLRNYFGLSTLGYATGLWDNYFAKYELETSNLDFLCLA